MFNISLLFADTPLEPPTQSESCPSSGDNSADFLSLVAVAKLKETVDKVNTDLYCNSWAEDNRQHSKEARSMEPF